MSDKSAKTLSVPLVTAYARHLHVAPRKMRLVTNAIRNMQATNALTQLVHMNKKAAPMVVKLLKSAIANAEHNFSLKPETLYIKSITTDMGKAMKRYFPRARGSAFVIRRKVCHVNLVLESRGVSGKKKVFAAPVAAKEKDEAKKKLVAQETSAPVVQDESPKKTRTFKTSEQKKMSTAQNKRRLFNRKSGE